MLTSILLATVLMASSTPTTTPATTPATFSDYSYDTDIVVRPVRERRSNMVGVELGGKAMGRDGLGYKDTAYKGAGAVGLMLSHNFTSVTSLDGIVDLGPTGLRGGLRARINMISNRLTPFVSLGASMSSGFNKVDLPGAGNKRVKIDGTPALQAGLGLSYINEGGFALLASVGYSQVLGGDNYRAIEGTTLTATDIKTLNGTLGSSPVATLALGYAF